MPVRFVLVYQDQRVGLPDGQIVVGRSITCQVRFNAPTVSRQHVILHVRGEDIRVENLSTTTGTLLNGRLVTEPTPVRPGDTLTLGPRQVRIERISAEEARALAPQPQPSLGLLPGDDDEESTTLVDGPRVGPSQLAAIAIHTCPSCRADVPFDRNICPSCGHVWGAEEPSSRIGQVTSRNVTDDVPMPAKVMAVYTSEAMTIDVILDDVHPGGAFVPTELLDAPGTPCEVTLLPDGQAPLPIVGEVVATRAVADRKGPPGLEVRFTEMSHGTRLWLDLFVRRRARTAPPT